MNGKIIAVVAVIVTGVLGFFGIKKLNEKEKPHKLTPKEVQDIQILVKEADAALMDEDDFDPLEVDVTIE